MKQLVFAFAVSAALIWQPLAHATQTHAPSKLDKVTLVRKIETEVQRMKAVIKKNPEDNRRSLGNAAYPATESLEKLLSNQAKLNRNDALLAVRVITDLIQVDPNYYGDPAETFEPLSSRPAFTALLRECKPGSSVPLPDQQALSKEGLAPVLARDVCDVRQMFLNIQRERIHGNG